MRSTSGIIKYSLVHGDEQVSGFIEMIAINVDPDKRLKGEGSKLLRELEKVALKEKINHIYIKPNIKNEGFKTFLTKNGYHLHRRKELWAKTDKQELALPG